MAMELYQKKTLSNNGGNMNDSATAVYFEINYVTLSPGKTITLDMNDQSGLGSYPCAYMTLYY